jgi:hypothetical protein
MAQDCTTRAAALPKAAPAWLRILSPHTPSTHADASLYGIWAHKDAPWTQRPQQQYNKQQVTTKNMAKLAYPKTTHHQVNPRLLHHFCKGSPVRASICITSLSKGWTLPALILDNVFTSTCPGWRVGWCTDTCVINTCLWCLQSHKSYHSCIPCRVPHLICQSCLFHCGNQRVNPLYTAQLPVAMYMGGSSSFIICHTAHNSAHWALCPQPCSYHSTLGSTQYPIATHKAGTPWQQPSVYQIVR